MKNCAASTTASLQIRRPPTMYGNAARLAMCVVRWTQWRTFRPMLCSGSCVLHTNLFCAMALGRRCGCDTTAVVTKSELSCTLVGLVTDASRAQGVLTRILLWRWPSVLKTGSILQICPALFCPLQAFLLEDEASQ